MKYLRTSVFAAALIFVGAQAFADDLTNDQTSAHKQMMKDCMTRMQAKNDGSTHEQMKSACVAQLKSIQADPAKNDSLSDHALKPTDKTPQGTKPSDETPAK